MAYKDFYQLMLEYFAQPVELITQARSQPFTLYVDNDILYVRNVKGKTRRIRPQAVAKFIAKFEEDESFSPSDYQGVTFNASYLLAAMRYITEKCSLHATIFRFNSDEFPDSEQQYHAWLAANPDGYVLNLLKRAELSHRIDPSASTCLHSAQCKSVNNSREYSQLTPFTGGKYFKICSTNLSELEAEAKRVTGLSTIKKDNCIKQLD